MDRRTFLGGFTLIVPGLARGDGDMADYVTRAEFDQLIQQLRSAPGSTNLPVFQSVPQVLDREGVGLLASSNGGWQNFYSFEGRGGLLLPDRSLDLEVACGLTNLTGILRRAEYRVQVNGETVISGVESAFSALALDGIVHMRLNQLADGTQQAYIDNVPGPVGTFEFAPLSLDLMSPWTLTFDVRWDIPDPGLLTLTFARNYVLLMLL